MNITSEAPISREEEKELIRKYQATKDSEIANKLVAANIKLIYKMVHEVINQGNFDYSIDDLATEGLYGFFVSLLAFNPDYDVKFMSYAESGIKQRMYKYINNENNQQDVSLQDHINEDGDTLENIIKDDLVPYDEVIMKTEKADVIHKLLTNLTDREHLIVKLYYFEELSCSDIGKRLNLSTNRTNQLLAKAVRKLRYYGIKQKIREGKTSIIKLGDRYIDTACNTKNINFA